MFVQKYLNIFEEKKFEKKEPGSVIFFRIGGPWSEQVSINGISEEAIAYNYKEVGIHNLAELRCAKLQHVH